MIPKFFKWTLTVIFVVGAAATLWILSRPGMSEVGIPYAKPAPKGSQLTVVWLGVATLLIDDGETQIMTDGFVSRPSLLDLLLEKPIAADVNVIKQVIKNQNIDRLAAIMPVHSHYDHALDTADFARLTGADIVGSTSTANIARSSMIEEDQIKTVRLGEALSYGKFTITFYESKHAPLSTNSGIEGIVTAPFELPAPYTTWKEGQSYAIHIAHPQGNILVQGSAGFVPGALKNVDADVVFLGSGGLMDLGTDYLSAYINETVHSVNPEEVFIIHHDNLFGSFGDVEQNKIRLSFDKTFALKLQQRVLPAKLQQLSFGIPIAVSQEIPVEK
jgi:L-ascorbate metabolism protein UlaG (beta-lactamase superfamily)